MASAIIVFSHLRWNFVFQRPQHLLCRLAAHHPIVFIEEPVHHEGEAFFHTYSPAPDVLVCVPHTPADMPGFHDDHLPHLQKLLRQLVRDYPEHIAWFYTPMALPLLQELEPQHVVYDCMDELASFKNAPRQLLQRESALLKVADIVFTGGRSLYRAKRDRHPNVHCFPSSVDAAHFVQALDRSNSHPAHREIPGPRLGFYGVIDERFDTELIAAVADAHPVWQIVLVGPVVKVDPANLPQRANIHYLGQQDYEALPQFLAGWDVCLLPFALNESTRFISPTKTLEYMAAELPIVSTPVADVAEAYQDVVAIAGDAQSFIAACEAALLAPPEEHARKVEKMRKVLGATSWDETVSQMHGLIGTLGSAAKAKALRQRAGLHPVSAPEVEAVNDAVESAANVNRLHPHAALRFAKTAIIGGGAAGLSAAYHLGHDALLLEKSDMVGGGCRSTREEGFIFDRAGHAMRSDDPDVLALYELLLGTGIRWQDSQAWVYSKNGYMRYPFRHELHRLRPETIEEAGIAERFSLAYRRKLLGLSPSEMDASALEPGDVAPDTEQMSEASLRTGGRLGYPAQGGFQALMSGFVPHIKGTVELNAEVIHVSPRQRILTLADGRRYQYQHLVSTMPLPELIKVMGDEAPEEVRQAAAGLKHVSLRCINLGVARENITDKHWIHYPEETVFHRIFAQGNASPDCNPPGGFGLTCEISYSPEWKPLPASGQKLVDLCIRDCIEVGLLSEGDKILTAHEVDIPYGLVVSDHARARHVETIKAWLERQDIVLAGAYGEWEPGDADMALLSGRKAAETVKWREAQNAVAAE